MSGNAKLLEVCNYIEGTWMEDGTVWSPKDWCVYGQTIRTNNDTEGWHRRLNFRVSSPPPFYKLIQLLHEEAKFVQTQMKLVNGKKLKKLQKRSNRLSEKNVWETWGRYEDGGMSVDKLLKKLSCVYGIY